MPIRTRSLFLPEPLHDVRRLLPCIHGFLIFLMSLVQQDIKYGNISHVTIALELGADLGTQQRWWHVKRVQSTDLRHLPFRVRNNLFYVA